MKRKRKNGTKKYKANYERNKQFEKLTANTMAIKEKMEKMQLAFRKAQGMDDCLYNMGGLSFKAPIALPSKFKISNAEKFDGTRDPKQRVSLYISIAEMKGLDKFDGTRDPKQRVSLYISIAEMKGLDKKQTLHAFPLSLTGGASRWYYNLDPSKTMAWNKLVELFVEQFIFNIVIDVTLRDLETTKQGVAEIFSDYMTRWKGKASKMVNSPNEKDQINIIIKNLLPAYNITLLSSSISSFRELCDCGTRIEDAINNGQLEKGENKPPIKKTYGGEATTSKAPNLVNVSAIIPLVYPSFTKKAHREFSNLGMTLASYMRT